MPNKPRTMETVRLSLEILRHIPRKGKITSQQLHAKVEAAGFKCSIRTIQRQMNELSDQFDIESDAPSKPIGYKWKPNARGLGLPILSEQESLLLALAEQQLRNLLPADLMRSLSSYFVQANNTLAPALKSTKGKEWLSKVRVVSTTQPLIPATIKSGIFEAVTNALFGNFQLTLTYKNSGAQEWTKTVLPLGLAQQGPSLYLVCRIDGYKNERSLALHRIQKAVVSTLTFARPKDFSLENYDDDGRFGFGEGKKIKLSFSISKDAGVHLTETPLSKDQKIVANEDHYRVTATLVQTAQLDWWLRGFGDEVWSVRRDQVK